MWHRKFHKVAASFFWISLIKLSRKGQIFSCPIARCLKKLSYLYLIWVKIKNIVWTCYSFKRKKRCKKQQFKLRRQLECMILKKKKKLRFLICSNHFNDKICVKSSCEISDFLAICNIILLSDLTKESKISEFQNHCRKYYQNSLWLDYYLKVLQF